jgi:hypothetical protein
MCESKQSPTAPIAVKLDVGVLVFRSGVVVQVLYQVWSVQVPPPA